MKKTAREESELYRKSFIGLNKENRCLEYSKSSSIPLAYKQNSLKEELILEHVIQYRKEFALTIDQKRELFLYPKNECGKYKFISTTIRPTKLPYPELYDYKKCAKFISEYIEYEELNPPFEFPKFIPAPDNVLKWQIGDCFDISIVLCSLLIGAGYNAYVVYGIAPRYITTKDEADLPPIDLADDIRIIEPDLSEKGDGLIVQAIGEKQIQESSYDKLKEKENKEREEDERRRNTVIDDDEPELVRYDPWEHKRIHAWILLKKNSRLDKNIFIEPATGRIYDTSQPVFEKIDAVFNNFNFYINLNPLKDASEVDLNLNNVKEWEYVMLNNKDNNEDKDDDIDGSESAGKIRPTEEDEKLMELLDMPPPWPNKVYIPLHSYNNRAPTATQTFFYRKTKVDKFAPYSQTDGLIMRIYRFEDYGRLRLYSVEYRYRNRGDKLYKKIKYPYLNKIEDYYLHGQPWHWKYVEEVYSKYRIVQFFPTNFENCLVSRIEYFGKKIIHLYQSRNDRIFERKVLLDKDYNDKPHSYRHFLDNPYFQRRILITKFSQKALPNPLLPIENQIHKIFYKFDNGTHIQVRYNYGKGKIHTAPKNFSINDGSSLANEERDEFNKKINNDEELWQKQMFLAKTNYINDFSKIEDYYHKKLEDSLKFYKKIAEYRTADNKDAIFNKVVKERDLPILERNIFDEEIDVDVLSKDKSLKYNGETERIDRLSHYLKIQQEKINEGSYDPLKTKEDIIKIFKEEKMAVTNILQNLLKEQVSALNKEIETFKDMDNPNSDVINSHNDRINDIQRKINIIYQRSHRHITKIMEDLNILLKTLDENSTIS